MPGDPETATGGYAYGRRIVAASTGELALLRLPAGFPYPTADDLAETGRLLAAAKGPVLVDGLAYGVLPTRLIDALPERPVALCHHPLGLEHGLSEAESRRLIEAERAALARAAHVVVTSEATARTLVADFGLAAEGVTVAPPGLDRAAPAAFHRGAAAETPTILTVASYTPRKAHDALLAALALIADRPWRAVWAGADDLDPPWRAKIAAAVSISGLGERIEMRGPCDAAKLDRLYDGADIFCLPSRYEGYGMVFAEAMMRGLPVVAAKAEAVRDLVSPAAGRLAPADDPAALAAALAGLLDDPAARRAAGMAGRERAMALPDWSETWRRVQGALDAARVGAP